MNYLENLKSIAKKNKSIVCLGLDPIIDDIPIETGNICEKISTFYEKMLSKMLQSGIMPSAAKPNYAFYAQYGLEGIQALLNVISFCKDAGLPVILDVKRGDIGKTAQAYAKESFEFFNSDAVTLAPYMGYDSIKPFMQDFPNKGYYVLTKTSNNSSGDIQDIECNGSPIFAHVADKILEWYEPGIGSVVGATFPEQLKLISQKFIDSNKEIPLLIPGVGAQGGSISEVLNILKNFKDITIHRINSSGAINFAYKQKPNKNFADAAVEALDELNTEIGQFINF